MKLSTRPALLLAWSVLLLSTSALPQRQPQEASSREWTVRDSTSGLDSGIILPRFLSSVFEKSLLSPRAEPADTSIPSTTEPSTSTPEANPNQSLPSPNSSSSLPSPNANQSLPSPNGQTPAAASSSLADLLARKCNINGCAQCKEPRKRANAAETALEKRAFAPVETYQEIEDLPATKDISEAANTNSGFLAFGANPLSVKVIGLEGCSVIAAMSDQGMIAIHLFEDGSTSTDPPRPQLTNTLHPNAFKDTLAATARILQAQASKLMGGQLVVLVPANRDGPNQGQRRYATEPWAEVNSRKTQYTNGEVFGPKGADSIDQAIIAMAQQATGLTPTVKEYQVSAILSQEEEDAQNVGTPAGTFVMQYDPVHATGATPKARDISIEGKSIFNGGISFA